jgi:hypothetical protein
LTSERNKITGARLLELSAAYRYEKYSDAGASSVPKYGLRWRPFNDELTLRSTYSEAFAAPTLFALFGPTTQGFTATTVIPSVFGVPGQAQSRTGSNPNLKPTTAKSFSYGAVYSPKAVRGLTVGFDFVQVDQVSLIGSAGSAEILRSVNELGTASPYVAQVALGNWPTNPDPLLGTATRITAPGQIEALLRSGNSPQTIFVTDSRINIAGQKVRALDVNASYAFPNSTLGNHRDHRGDVFPALPVPRPSLPNLLRVCQPRDEWRHGLIGHATRHEVVQHAQLEEGQLGCHAGEQLPQQRDGPRRGWHHVRNQLNAHANPRALVHVLGCFRDLHVARPRQLRVPPHDFGPQAHGWRQQSSGQNAARRPASVRRRCRRGPYDLQPNRSAVVRKHEPQVLSFPFLS